MNSETIPQPISHRDTGEVMRASWVRLADDFARLSCVGVIDANTDSVVSRYVVRDVGELLLRGHDDALAEAERYIIIGHTIRTGHVVEYDDIDDVDSLARWARELDRASNDGFAPAVPEGFWASFLRWRTPLGMARLTDRRIRVLPRVAKTDVAVDLPRS